MNLLKRNASNPIEEATKKIEAATTKVDGLEKKKADLVRRKRNLILAGQDARSVNEAVRLVEQQTMDIREILLPQLNQKLKNAEAEEKEKQRQEKVDQILTDDETLYAEIPERIAALKEHQARYQANLNRLKEALSLLLWHLRCSTGFR